MMCYCHTLLSVPPTFLNVLFFLSLKKTFYVYEYFTNVYPPLLDYMRFFFF